MNINSNNVLFSNFSKQLSLIIFLNVIVVILIRNISDKEFQVYPYMLIHQLLQ